MIALTNILLVLLQAAQWIIIIQAVLSWLIAFNVISAYNPTLRPVWTALERLTEPLYRPIRRILPDFGALDLSPLVALIAILCLEMLIGRFQIWYMGQGPL